MQSALAFEIEEGAPVEFQLPFVPKSKNQWAGMPHLHQASYRKKWRRHLDEILPSIGLDRVSSVRVEIELWFGSRRRRDWQNYAFPLHWDLADALVEAGILLDDTPDQYRVGENGGIVFRTDVNRLVRLEDRQHTVIRLYPMER